MKDIAISALNSRDVPRIIGKNSRECQTISSGPFLKGIGNLILLAIDEWLHAQWAAARKKGPEGLGPPGP
jgi:hypothetical protein